MTNGHFRAGRAWVGREGVGEGGGTCKRGGSSRETGEKRVAEVGKKGAKEGCEVLEERHKSQVRENTWLSFLILSLCLFVCFLPTLLQPQGTWQTVY